AVPSLRPGTVYELAVGAIGADGAVGPRAVTTRRTGRDTSPPTPALAARVDAGLRTSARLSFTPSTDNVRVSGYRIERRVGTRWLLVALVPAPRIVPGQSTTRLLVRGLRAGTRYSLRVRARDTSGNLSAPSRVLAVTTTR
ncbi:MAG: sugar hydrolase, partial [Thermoleophilia bacterium]|nr:sugar hydrolase [Thermoleophilia bacterium]